MQKVSTDKLIKKQLEEEPSITEQIRARPMSKLSREKFSIEDVNEIKGELLLFNDKFFSKHFPVRKEELAKLTVFTYRIEIEYKEFFKQIENEKGPYWDFRHSASLLRQRGHGRNLCFNVTFSDDKGNFYKYIDIKGIGLPRNVTDIAGVSNSLNLVDKIRPSETIRKAIRGMWGLLDYESAVKDWEQSIELMKGGVEIAPPVAIIKINELFLKNGERKTIEELKKEGVMPRKVTYDNEEYDYTPVLYLRAFTEAMRLEDATKEDFEKFAKEHGMTLEEYVDWWTGKVAKNLARMHMLGKIHNNLISHNLTMDGHIVDFDTVETYHASDTFQIGETNLLRSDINTARRTLDDLSRISSDAPSHEKENMEEKRTLFLDTYFENFTDIPKENFKELCYLLKTQSRIEISDKTRKLFEKRFGEPLHLP